MTTAVKDPFELARKMRGKVEELDDSYIEKWLPQHILDRILSIPTGCHLVDEDGFWWSPNRVMASKIKLTGEIVVLFADKSGGLGYHEIKGVDRHGNESIYKGHELL